MADKKITMDLEVNDARAVAAWLRFKNNVGAAEDELRRLNEQQTKNRKGAESFDSAVGKWVKTYASVSLAAQTTQKIIHSIVEENLALSRGIDELLGKLPEAETKLQTQGGLTKEQVNAQMPIIQQALLRTPSTDFMGGIDLQKQLLSSGFKAEDVESGAALQTALDFKAAATAFGEEIEDPAEALKGLAQFLKGSGIAEPSAADIRRVGGKVTQLKEVGDIELEDLGALAPKAANLTQRGLSENMQLASFSWLTDIMGGDEGATGLDQATAFMKTAASNKKGQKGLAKLGLKAEDIDFIGEDFLTALKRLKKAVDAVDEETASGALTDIFGRKAQTGVQGLLAGIPEIESRMESLETDKFERNVGLFQESRLAKNRRTGLKTEFAYRDLDIERGEVTFGELRKEIDLDLAQQSRGKGIVGRIGAGVQAARKKGAAYTSEALNLEPSETGVGETVMPVGGNLSGLGMLSKFFEMANRYGTFEDNRNMKDLVKHLQENTQALREGNQKRNPTQKIDVRVKVNQSSTKAEVAPAMPVSAAALGEN